MWKYAETEKAYKTTLKLKNITQRYMPVSKPKSMRIASQSRNDAKANGNYDQALKTFKLSVKKLAKNNSWVLKKSKRMVESTK